MPKTVKVDLVDAAARTAARMKAKAAEDRAMAAAQQTPEAREITDPGKSVARGNRIQREEAKESKLINRTGTGYGSFRNR
jgi:hypothetical protein